MATIHRFPVPETAHDETLLARLGRLARLEMELGLAETRLLLRRIAIAGALAVLAVIALVAAHVVLLAAAFAPLFGARWEHLVIAGGGTALIALAGLAWSAWRLTHLQWPKETLTSFEENWRWLGVQLRSRLTLR